MGNVFIFNKEFVVGLFIQTLKLKKFMKKILYQFVHNFHGAIPGLSSMHLH